MVDDQYGIRVLLNEILQKDGYTVFQAANGVQALSIVKDENPDLILLGYENSRDGWLGDP